MTDNTMMDKDNQQSTHSRHLAASFSSEDQHVSRTEEEQHDGLSTGSYDEDGKMVPLAARETRAVKWSKLVVLIVLFLAAGAVASVTYNYTRRQEEEDFSTRFKDVSAQIISIYEINARAIRDVYTGFSLQLTSYAMGTKATWPYVTLPNFEAQGMHANEQTGATSLGVGLFVPASQRQQWQNFTVENNGWVQESYEYQGNVAPEMPPMPHIWSSFSTFGPATGPQPDRDAYMPLWQSSPVGVGPSLLNYDMFGFAVFPFIYDRMFRLRSPVLSEVRNLDPSADDLVLPESMMLTPVFDNLKQQGDIVAVIVSMLAWKNYFINLMPPGIGSVHLVIRNTCNQTQTYLIDGPDVEYLGPADLHDSKYSSYVVATSFNPFTSEMECAHTLEFYPTEEFEENFISSRPIKYTVGTVFIFALTALVFTMYDCLVEKRQNKVMTTAQQSSAIVSSMFPANVRDRLMDNAIQGTNSSRANKSSAADTSIKKDQQRPQPESSDSTVDALKRFASFQQGGQNHHINHNMVPIPGSRPIADLFPSASVFFADIAGFTKWSSDREPTHVFTLLETIYNSFDRLARRRKVFKVETIGDCYVAAAGLPEKLPDHATVMAKFAIDCLHKMNQAIKQLEPSLGPDTSSLRLRVGIHSGPVTAGVLRGEKSRFQLFGDTVNTAARMEGNGEPGRIHISQETADLIVEDGDADLYVVARSKMIEAKGKGTMQTYWIAPRPAQKSMLPSTSFHGGIIVHSSDSDASKE